MDPETVTNLTEAMGWFLRHSQGGIRCVKISDDGAEIEMVAHSFLEAEEFYGGHVERIPDSPLSG